MSGKRNAEEQKKVAEFQNGLLLYYKKYVLLMSTSYAHILNVVFHDPSLWRRIGSLPCNKTLF